MNEQEYASVEKRDQNNKNKNLYVLTVSVREENYFYKSSSISYKTTHVDSCIKVNVVVSNLF